MKTRIHVNQHNIKFNRKREQSWTLQHECEAKPVLTVKDYKQNRKGNKAAIVDADGNVLASVVYRPDKLLPCGAHIWIETELTVKVTS